MCKKFLTLPLMALCLLLFSACAAVIDSEGAKIGDPKAFAEATHIARLSSEAAAATATSVAIDVTRQAAAIKAEATRQAQTVRATATAQAIAAYAAQQQADKVKAEANVKQAEAQAQVNALPAASAGYAVAYIGLGVGALVLVVGLAFASVAWVNKRATAVYPDRRGQFPVVVSKGIGWIAFHDPNRALGSATVARVPTLADSLAGVLVASVRALRSGNTPSLPVAEPQAAFPMSGSEPAMLQIAMQEQAAQVRIAENPEHSKVMVAMLPQEKASRASGEPRGRMPKISVINDADEIAAFEQKLLGPGGSDD